MAWPLLQSVFTSVLISTNTVCVQPRSIHDDYITDKWVEVFSKAENCRIMGPKEGVKYWKAQLYAWDDYGMDLEEWGAILYKYKLRKILQNIRDELEELRDMKETIRVGLEEWHELIEAEKNSLETTKSDDKSESGAPVQGTTP